MPLLNPFYTLGGVSLKYIALIPAYEPEEILLNVLKNLKKEGMEIVLVDDGSGPLFKALFVQASFFGYVISYSANRGKGAALKAGMSYISSVYSADDIIVTVDADGQHRAEDAKKLCDLAAQYPDSLILGSRLLGETAPFRSQFGNTITRWVFESATGQKVYDTQTGLRAFQMGLLPELMNISGERYEYEMNVLLELSRKKIPIQESQITTIYIDNNAGSHFHALKDSFRIYKEILKFSASSFVGFLVDYGLYSILLLITANFLLSNVLARIVSAAVNFTLNRRYVFRAKGKLMKALLQYSLLALGILCGNTILLKWLVSTWGVHEMLAKLLTEIMFFLISWSVQHNLIFISKTGDQ